MKRLLPIVVLTAILIAAVSKPPEARPEKQQAAAKNIQDETKQSQETSTQWQMEILDALRGIEKQQIAANEQSRAEQ